VTRGSPRWFREVAVADPQWMAGFLGWLRGDANMRSASLVGALEAARALVAAGVAGGRQIVASVLQRAGRARRGPGLLDVAVWPRHPEAVKRGIADAALALYAEYPLLKYDTTSHGVRFADVLDLTHPGDQGGSSQARRFQGGVAAGSVHARARGAGTAGRTRRRRPSG